MRLFIAQIVLLATALAQPRAGGSDTAIFLGNTQGLHIPEFPLPERLVTVETWVKLLPVSFGSLKAACEGLSGDMLVEFCSLM